MDDKILMKDIRTEIDNGRNNLNETEFGVSQEKLLSALRMLQHQEYISGPFVKKGMDGTVSKLTDKGRKFLYNN